MKIEMKGLWRRDSANIFAFVTSDKDYTTYSAVALAVGVWNIGINTPDAENLILRTFINCARSLPDWLCDCASVNKMKFKFVLQKN